MKKTITLFFSLALLLLQISHLRCQILFHEDFESGFGPNGWQVGEGWATGASSEISSQSFQIPSHTIFAAINDDGAGPGVTSSDAIVTPRIDLEGAGIVLLTFDCYFLNGDYEGADETAKVLISTDSMATWTELLDINGTSQWQSITILLGDDYVDEKINIAFDYHDGGGWNYGFCVDNVKVEPAPDYFAQVGFDFEQPYTVLTPNQMRPMTFIHKFENFGTQTLSDIRFIFRVRMGATLIHQDTQFLASIASGVFIMDTTTYLPTAFGKYTFQFLASHPELGTNFYSRALVNTFELSGTDMAKDDGERDVSIGMSFGDPNWYGYYGSEFDLVSSDTLAGISVFMATSTAGSFNLLVNVKDELGAPTVELFHSEPIPIGAGFNGWVYYPLPSPLPLSAGNYVFAVGQDTVQGIMGHGFDTDRQNLGY